MVIRTTKVGSIYTVYPYIHPGLNSFQFYATVYCINRVFDDVVRSLLLVDARAKVWNINPKLRYAMTFIDIVNVAYYE